MATKKLAKKLGLIQQYNPEALDSAKDQRPVDHQKQVFDYLLVLDFESTCWEEKSMNRCLEIIEFPVVLLEVSTGKMLSEFHQYILPTEHPSLSKFCTTFTGIQQLQIDNGIPLPTAIALFSRWLKDLCIRYVFTMNLSSPGKHAAFATWSDWDLGTCLHYECTRKNLRKPEYFNQWIDVRLTYRNFYKRRPEGLSGALQELGIKFEGREHSGIADTRNTAALATKMINDGCIFQITKTIAHKSFGCSSKHKR